jgi:hypothetical protein
VEFGPLGSSGDEFVVTNQGGGTARIELGSEVAQLSQSEVVSGGWEFDTNDTTFITAILADGGINTTLGDGLDLVLDADSGAVDLANSGLYTAGTSRLTNAGALENITGLDVISGTVALPAGEIGNAELANSSLTVTAGGGLTDGGLVSLGGSTTLNIGAGSGITVNADNVTVDLTAATDALSATTSSGSGLEVLASGLTLLQGCSDSQILKWNETTDSWDCAADTSGGAPALNTITAAIGTNTINNGDHAQAWNWALTTAAKTAFNFGENSAAINGAGSQYLLGISTLASSTAAPLRVVARGNAIIDTTPAGGITIGNATAAQTIAIDSGSGNIDIGTSVADKTVSISDEGNSGVIINAGTGGLKLGDNATTKMINIGGVDTSGTDTISIATDGTTADAISIGNSNAATAVDLTGGNDWSITTGGALTLASLIRGADTITDFSGNGLTVSGNSLTINLPAATDALSATTSSGSGLEALTAGLTLLQGCSDGQILKWNETSDTWACGADNSGGGGATLQTAYDSGNTILTTTARDVAITLGEVLVPTSVTITNLDSAGTSGLKIANATALGTLTNGLLIDNTLAGTLTNAIQISETLGTITDGILITGTLGNILNSGSIDITGVGAITGATGISSTGNISLGDTTGATAVNINSGTGNVNFTVGPTSSSGQVRIGNSGTATPDLLVLDNGTADPTGTNGATYYNTTSNKFRCYQNGAWTDCIGGDKIFLSKSTDQAVNNSTTLVDDTALQFSVSSGQTWVIKFDLIVSNASSANPDWKSAILAPAGSTCGAQLSGSEGVGTIFPQVTTTDCTTPGTLVNANVADDAGAGFNVSIQAVVTTGSAGSIKLQWAQNSAAITDLTVKAGSVGQAFRVGGADLAEVYYGDQAYEPGTVVSLNGAGQAKVTASARPYDHNVIGIVSTKPGLVIGDDSGSGAANLVALSGRVPVKVSAENGPIKSGDYLTTSSMVGIAMKATKAGAIIGTAMTDFSGDGVGTVVAFVKNGSSAGTLAGLMPGLTGEIEFGRNMLTQLLSQPIGAGAQPTDLTDIFADRIAAGVEIVAPQVTAQNLKLTGILSLLGTDGTEIIRLDLVNSLFKNAAEFFERVVFHGDVAFLGRPTFNKDTAGFAFVPGSASEVEVRFEKEYAHNPVVTANVNLSGAVKPDEIPEYAIADLTPQGFKIRLARPAGLDLNFSWIALAVEVQATPAPASQPAQPAAPATPEATVEPTTQPSPSATPEPIPEATPEPTAAPEPTPTPEITPEPVENASSSAQPA